MILLMTNSSNVYNPVREGSIYLISKNVTNYEHGDSVSLEFF